MEMKARNLRFKHPEFRAVTETDGVRRIRGYPIVFGVPGHPYYLSKWTEVVDKDALKDIDLTNLFLFIEHNPSFCLAKYGVNLRAEVDSTGLFIEATLGNTYVDDYTFDRVSRGILDAMSFRFFTDDVRTDSIKMQDTIMHITMLLEVSIVAFPAYEQAVAVATETPADTAGGQRGAGTGDTPEEEARKKAAAALDLALALAR
jgi:HK97 family phage prohead protease